MRKLTLPTGIIEDGSGAPTGTPMADPPLVEMISEDPVLRNTKLISEAWDCDGLFQVRASLQQTPHHHSGSCHCYLIDSHLIPQHSAFLHDWGTPPVLRVHLANQLRGSMFAGMACLLVCWAVHGMRCRGGRMKGSRPAGVKGYEMQVGAFPHYGGRWAEWNGNFRDTARSFIKGSEGPWAQAFASAVCGSPTIYAATEPAEGGQPDLPACPEAKL